MVLDHLYLKFIKPVEVLTECYGSLYNESYKTHLKPHQNKTIKLPGKLYMKVKICNFLITLLRLGKRRSTNTKPISYRHRLCRKSSIFGFVLSYHML